MTPLARRLARLISLGGPITVADYMAQVLTDPEHGYYMAGDPFGRTGDFVTAPEISQMFGELIGLWCADTWRRMGAPRPVVLAELGPGRGTLMADLLRAARTVPDFLGATQLHLVEVSPALRKRQGEALDDQDVTWHEGVADLPEGPMILIANEFFDALPVRQFQRDQDGWCERLVGLDESGALAFGLSRPTAAVVPLIPPALRDALPGRTVEVSPTGQFIAEEIGRRVACHGGAALIIDYGYTEARQGFSLQATRHHDRHEVLEKPGLADLAAHVDFSGLAEAARAAGARVHGPVAQGGFLERLGLEARAQALLARADRRQRREIEAARERLGASDQMGVLFKVMALTHPELDDLAGFQ